MPSNCSVAFRSRPCLDMFTEREIGEILTKAFESLPQEQQSALMGSARELLDIPGLGQKGLLRLVFVSDPTIAAILDRLDAAILKGGN